MNSLTPRDRRRYQELKKLISTNLWDAAGYASEIHDSKLYLEEYETFDEFLKAELGYSRQRFYQLKNANIGKKHLENANLVSSMLDKVSVRAAEEIGKADEKDVQKIIDKSVEIAQQQDSPLTAKIIKQAAEEIASPVEEYEDVSDEPEPPKPNTKEQVSKLRSVALQHYKAAMRAVDDMQAIKKDKASHAIVERENVVIQEAVTEGWK